MFSKVAIDLHFYEELAKELTGLGVQSRNIHFMRLAGFLFFIMLSITGYTQSIKGTLMDPVEGIVVKGVTVQLLKAADSSAFKTTVSDSSGTFLFSNLETGN